jgi:hypothetical protein
MEREMLEFGLAMGRHSTATLYDIREIIRYGATYRRFAITACNRELSFAEMKRWGACTNHLLRICSELGLKAILGGDPRGCVVKIQVPDGFTNDFGNEGICVPKGGV